MGKHHLRAGGVTCLCGREEDSVKSSYDYEKCTCKICLKVSQQAEYKNCYGRTNGVANSQFDLTQDKPSQVN